MDLFGGMTASQKDKLEDGLAVAVGILTWEVQSTTPFDVGISPFSTQRFADAISQTFGISVAKSMFPTTALRSTGQAITPAGALNKYTFGGIGLLILDAALDAFVGSPYKNMDGLPNAVRGIGKGLIGGGIVGGFFNPYTTARPGGINPALGSPSPASAPQLSSYTVSAASVNRMLGG